MSRIISDQEFWNEEDEDEGEVPNLSGDVPPPKKLAPDA